MRKMQEYIVKGKHIFIGLEDSKRTWKLCVRCDDLIIHETSMPAEYPILHTYLTRRFPECRIALMYEAGFAGFGLYDRLTADGVTCVVTPPHSVTQAKVSRVKTDTRDARRLAQNLEHQDFKRCWIPDPEWRTDRQLSRTLDQLTQDRTRLKNRIRRFLDFHGLNGTLSPGPWSHARYRALRTMAWPPAVQLPLAVLLDHLAHLEVLQQQVVHALQKVSRKPRYQAAVQAKHRCIGVGWQTAIRLTLEWGPMSRFPTRTRFSAFTGLTPSEYSTGETIRRGRITGASHKPVRQLLIQCAWRAYRRDPVLLAKFQAVWAHSGSKKKAIVAVARKLALRMRACELTGQPYTVGVVE